MVRPPVRQGTNLDAYSQNMLKSQVKVLKSMKAGFKSYYDEIVALASQEEEGQNA
jgi:hypothetical protein